MDAGDWEEASARSYYAAFHAISAVLLSRNLAFSKHAQTIGSFNREFVKSGIFPSDFGAILKRLMENRMEGDYGVIARLGEEDANADTVDAEKILNKCVEYLEKVSGVSAGDKT